MNYSQLKYIIAVNKHRHFVKAAQECAVTQPTLSMQLSKLEEELGVIIFDRSKSPLIPTKDGEKIIAQAKLAIREFDRISQIAQAQEGVIEGEFKLAITSTLSPYLVPLFLEEFTSTYPAVELILEECSPQEILYKLSNDEIDAAVMATPVHDDSLIERVLFYEPFYIFVSDKHPLSKKKIINETDLNTEEVWLLKEGHCFRNQTLKICSSGGRGRNRDNVRFESGNLETLKNLVMKGSGYTLLPHLAIHDLSSEQKHFVRKFKCPAPSREISIVHRRAFLKEKVIEALQETILKNLPKCLKSIKKGNIEIVDTCTEP